MLHSLEIRGFRNIEEGAWTFGPGSHLILGPNGAGKTSLLESIYVLGTTRSFRTPRIEYCCKHGESHFGIVGEVVTDRRVRLEFGWRSDERSRTVDSNQASLCDYLSILPIVSWSGGDSDLLVGPPEARRRFLDRGVIGLHATGMQILSQYRQILREKRRLLQSTGMELETWNQMLSRAASKLIDSRNSYVERLRRCLVSVLAVSGLELGPVEINYRSSLRSGLSGPDAIMAELMAASGRERALQRPLLGPHRDDLVIRWGGHELRRVASAGERKALGLALMLAHGRFLCEVGRDPVYLLDDADVELDQDRLRALWKLISRASQVFLTSNRLKIWEGLEIRHQWFCGNGKIESQIG